MRFIALMGLALCCLGGCAGVVEFNTPKEFRNEKVKEDPPGTLLPLKPEFRTC